MSNSLAKVHPELISQWSDKNLPLTPDGITYGSNKLVWWNAELFLRHFSCLSLRHTFTTRMCEAGVNVKVIQDTLGHKDISTTLNIYTDVTKELKRSAFEGLDFFFRTELNS